jgi:hypothetical protein
MACMCKQEDDNTASDKMEKNGLLRVLFAVKNNSTITEWDTSTDEYTLSTTTLNNSCLLKGNIILN